MQRERGCTRNGFERNSYAWAELDVQGELLEVWDCAVNMVGPREHHIMRVAGYLRGQMPWYGSNIGEWPAKVLRGCEVFNAEVNDLKDGDRKRG